MTRTSVAVVAHDAIGDEVFRACRDVIEAHRLAKWLDARDREVRRGLERLAGYAQVSGDCGIDGGKKPQLFHQSAIESHDVDGFGLSPVHVFYRKAKSEFTQGLCDPVNQLTIRIGDAKDTLAIASLGIKNAC